MLDRNNEKTSALENYNYINNRENSANGLNNNNKTSASKNYIINDSKTSANGLNNNYISSKTNVTENSNKINDNTSARKNGDECYAQNSLCQGYRCSQCNVNINYINTGNTSAPQINIYINNNGNSISKENNNNINKSAFNRQCTSSFKGNDEFKGHTDGQSSDAEITEISNVINTNNINIVKEKTCITENYSSYNNGDHSYGPKWLSRSVDMFMIVIRGVFILKYYKKRTDALSYLRNVIYLSDADVERLFNAKLKSNCTPCQYCCFLACFNCMGAMMPPTPSPYSSPIRSPSKWRKTPTSSTTLTERQYHSLYRDFKHASQIELRDQTSRNVRIEESLGPVEEEMREIIHPFMSGIFTTLVEDYLKLFEEMVKGLILLKETGITLKDICSIDEERHNYYCQQSTSTMKNDSKISFCRPYNEAEFEKLLQDELKIQFQSRLRDAAKCSHIMYQESDHGREIQTCDCEQATMDNNPYLTFLTETNCHSSYTLNTEAFDQILRIEKKKFLKNCLKLLRENEYFGFHSQLSPESEYFDAAVAECNSHKSPTKQDIDNAEMCNMSVGIYNQTICNVQSAILAIFRSMKYGEQDRKRVPPTSNKTSDMEINAKISKSKNLIKNSLSQYLKPADLSTFSKDEVFIYESLNRDAYVQDSGTAVKYLNYNETDKGFQAIPSIKYEHEIKSRPLKYKPTPRRNSQYEPCIKRFPQPLLEITQQHPDLEYADAGHHTCKGHGMNRLPTQNKQENATKRDFLLLGEMQDAQIVGKTSFPPQNTRYKAARAGHLLEKIQENLEKTDHPPQKGKTCLLNRLLFKSKKNDVCVMCVLNYSKPEVSHTEAIAFLKKMETEGGTFHYPHCSENTLLTKIEGPSFYFSVCCAVCRQELAPPEKLEAFKSEPEYTHRSKVISYIIRKSRASFYFPVQCGSCGYFLCDPQKAKKLHLYVPFHSPVKGFICASRLRSHKCQASPSDTQYTGCISDTANTSNSNTHGQKIFEKGSKRRSMIESYDCLKSPNHKYMARSRSLPVLLRKNDDFRDIMENVIQTSHPSARRIEFEDAVTNILNMWTYEMIDYEKGANSPQLRSQIMSYRKSRSKCIKKDIIEKLYYRHVFSVFKRIEDYESPILEDKGISAQTSTTHGKIIRRSRSCHSKLTYETTSATHRSKSESLVCKDFSRQITTFKQTLSEIEKDAKRPQSFYRKNITSGSFHSVHNTTAASRKFKSEPLEYNNIISIPKNTRQHTLLNPDKVKSSLYLRPERLNRKNIARPISLCSELKQKTPTTHRRRSCSLTTESMSKADSCTEINAWKDELLDLQKSVESPHLRFESRKNKARPLSLHSEFQQKTLATHRRRRSSCSFATESGYQEYFSTQRNTWRHEMFKLQKSVQSPQIGSETLNRKNMARPNSLDSDLKQKTAASHRHRRSYSFATSSVYRDDFSSKINAWKDELQELQKSVESPHLRSEMNRIHKASSGAGSLHSESKQSTSTVTSCQPEIDDSLTELKAWNQCLRELEKDATRPYLRSETLNRKIKTRAVSLYTEPKHTATGSRNRPKSESVLHNYSSELNTWHHELQKLEDESKNPHLQFESQFRKNIATSCSLNSEQKYQTAAVAHRVNFGSLHNKGDTSRRHTWMAPMQTPLKPNIHARTNVPCKPPVCRYSVTPRQLPAIPNQKNARRHSHYETSGNFVNLLSSERKATRLNANTPNHTVSSCRCDNQGSIRSPNETSEGFLRPDDAAAHPT